MNNNDQIKQKFNELINDSEIRYHIIVDFCKKNNIHDLINFVYDYTINMDKKVEKFIIKQTLENIIEEAYHPQFCSLDETIKCAELGLYVAVAVLAFKYKHDISKFIEIWAKNNNYNIIIMCINKGIIDKFEVKDLLSKDIDNFNTKFPGVHYTDTIENNIREKLYLSAKYNNLNFVEEMKKLDVGMIINILHKVYNEMQFMVNFRKKKIAKIMQYLSSIDISKLKDDLLIKCAVMGHINSFATCYKRGITFVYYDQIVKKWNNYNQLMSIVQANLLLRKK